VVVPVVKEIAKEIVRTLRSNKKRITITDFTK
jgi:hypothetical protein